MRIAVWYNLPSGGGKRALYYHLKGLRDRGHDIRIWCPPTADRLFCPLSEFGDETVLPMEEVPLKRLPFRRWLSPYREAVGRITSLTAHCESCAAEISKWNADVLFAGSCSLIAAAPIGRLVEIPSVLYLGEPQRLLHEAMGQNPWLLAPRDGANLAVRSRAGLALEDLARCQSRRYRITEEIRNAHGYTKILVNSCFSRESVLRAYGIDATVCYLGIDTDLFKYQGRDKKPFLVGLGAFHHGKGIDRAIAAVAAIPRKWRPELIWIGNNAHGGGPDEYRLLAEKSGVQFSPLVRVPDSKVVELLNDATLMLYTSRLEPFGFAPLEANACGTPVVAIAEGGVRETIEDGVNGFLAEDGRAGALAEQMLKLLRDPERVKRMGAASRELVEQKWGWKLAIDRLEQLLLASCESFKPVDCCSL